MACRARRQTEEVLFRGHRCCNGAGPGQKRSCCLHRDRDSPRNGSMTEALRGSLRLHAGGLHSGLTTWSSRGDLAGDCRERVGVVVGARSALFPAGRPISGLIVGREGSLCIGWSTTPRSSRRTASPTNMRCATWPWCARRLVSDADRARTRRRVAGEVDQWSRRADYGALHLPRPPWRPAAGRDLRPSISSGPAGIARPHGCRSRWSDRRRQDPGGGRGTDAALLKSPRLCADPRDAALLARCQRMSAMSAWLVEAPRFPSADTLICPPSLRLHRTGGGGGPPPGPRSPANRGCRRQFRLHAGRAVERLRRGGARLSPRPAFPEL